MSAVNSANKMKLNSSQIKYIDQFSSFGFKETSRQMNTTFSDSYEEIGDYGSNLEELDFSYNKLSTINLHSTVYLSNLRTLNLSNNLIKNFDLHFMSAVVPGLINLDLSFNLIKKLQILTNHVYLSTISNSTVSMPMHSIFKSDKLAPLQISSNLIMKDLSYLNLNGNNLFSFAEFLGLNINSLNDSRFCNRGSNEISSER